MQEGRPSTRCCPSSRRAGRRGRRGGLEGRPSPTPRATLLERLLPMYVEVSVFRATFDSSASEQACFTHRPRNPPRAELRFLPRGAGPRAHRHPHVANSPTSDRRPQGFSILVMELLEGESLGALLERHPDTSARRRTADIMIPLCAAVDAAHREGIIHRDLKPENIFLSRDAHGQVVPKVLDFGISKVQHAPGEALTGTQRWMGTPQYMSPEQAASGREVDARTDIYALGVVLYECVCGELPYPDDDLFPLLRAIVEGEFHPPRAKLPEVSTAMEAVILRAMAKSPGARFDDAMALGQALLPFASPAVHSRWSSVFADSDRTHVRVSTVGETGVPTLSDVRTQFTPVLSVTTIAAHTESPLRRRSVVHGAVAVTLALVIIAILLPSSESNPRVAKVEVQREVSITTSDAEATREHPPRTVADAAAPPLDGTPSPVRVVEPNPVDSLGRRPRRPAESSSVTRVRGSNGAPIVD
ncbi:MAG: protein kinase [Polyangiales bacterium]